jgi:uncharacterized protein (TIGR04562 family)
MSPQIPPPKTSAKAGSKAGARSGRSEKNRLGPAASGEAPRGGEFATLEDGSDPVGQALGEAERLRRKYEFRWDVLDIIVSGKSAIDTGHGFRVRSVEEAERFIRSYGYELENAIERAELFGNYHEALSFIRRYFLQPDSPDGLKLDIPRKLIELSDVRDLFVFASARPGAGSAEGTRASGLKPGSVSMDMQTQYLRLWSCALLKVMHTIAHVDQDLRTSYFAEIQKQILDRYYRVIHRDESGALYLGERSDDPDRVDLNAFETKPKKSRESILLKLMHKPENVAEDIFDRVGIRFVTRSRLGALRVIKFLKDRMILMPPNVKPSRSRNTLIDIDAFRQRLDELLAQVSRGELDEGDLVRELEGAAANGSGSSENPHTSEHYRAIQFTSRQLIKLRNPLYDDLKELRSLAKTRKLDGDVARIIDRVDLKYLQREVRFFYPYEVQVVDQKSFEENEKGRSAHSEYKRAQVQTALKRVMGALLDWPNAGGNGSR